MSTALPQLSLDDEAAQMAERLMGPDGRLSKGGAAGDMPVGRGGTMGAEGGFTPQAGGQVIDAQAAKAMQVDDQMDKAGAYTGSQVTNEPGRQGMQPQTGDDVTSEPKGETGGGAGDGGNLAQGGDDKTRQRKAGKVGGMGDGGAEAGKNLAEDEDDKTRKRKSGKVGMAKGGDTDEDEMEESCAKSEFNADELIKSLQTLEAVAQGSSVPAPAERREVLAEKLADGTLSKSEMAELSDLMKADQFAADQMDEAEAEDELNKSYQEVFSDDPELSEGYEVSPFLERYGQMTAAALDQVQSSLAKSLESHRDHTSAFNAQLAKSLMGMAQLAQSQDVMIKSLVERIDTIEQQPVPRRGVTSQSQILNKSMGGSEVGVSDQLTKSQVADTLEQMAIRGVMNTASGHRIDHAMAMLEQPSGQITKSLYNDVLAWRQQQNGTVGVR